MNEMLPGPRARSSKLPLASSCGVGSGNLADYSRRDCHHGTHTRETARSVWSVGSCQIALAR
ncbi:MAG: hypothetical protein ACJ797_07515 [Ktedonobacteraceae bacterium]